MMDEVTEERRIEIRREAGAIKGRFILMLPKPEEGSVAAAVLPQQAEPAMNTVKCPRTQNLRREGIHGLQVPLRASALRAK